MNICKDIKVEGKHGRPVLIDTYNLSTKSNLPVVILAHGFKGFKDWGHWHLIAQEFAKEGYFFVKFNFSHNGTTPEQPTEFADLEAFGQNNYTKELADIDTVLEWLERNQDDRYRLDQTTLIGHSRGGGVAIVKAANEDRIKQLITWASIHQLGYGSHHPDILKEWKEKGVWHIMNGRTKQQMPLYYQLQEDFLQNQEKLDVKKAATNFNKPWLLIHGTEDNAVPLTAGFKLKEWNPNIMMEIIENANHVFGGKHPFETNTLPLHSRQLCAKSIEFLKLNKI